jgi:hypothetical protein
VIATHPRLASSVLVRSILLSSVGPMGWVESSFVLASMQRSYLFPSLNPLSSRQTARLTPASSSNVGPTISWSLRVHPVDRWNEPLRPLATCTRPNFLEFPSPFSSTSHPPLSTSAMSTPVANYDLVRSDIKAILNQPE